MGVFCINIQTLGRTVLLELFEILSETKYLRAESYVCARNAREDVWMCAADERRWVSQRRLPAHGRIGVSTAGCMEGGG